jgi:ADP-heptose:LPS heptosyltransferase
MIRTSAMGDVALTVPVIRALNRRYPDTKITFVTRPAFAPFFNDIEQLDLFFTDFKKKHKGFTGIFKLFRDLRRLNRIDHIIDLHDVLRSKIIRWLFRLTGVPATVIDKGRAEKRKVITGKNKHQLKHSVMRYFDVLTKAGFSFQPVQGPWIIPSENAMRRIASFMNEPDLIHIGVAPFAKHDLKTWPEKYIITLLELITKKYKVRLWLFGGKEETRQLISLQDRIPESVLVAGTLSLDEELALISRLNFMIAMDSSNMHMAALTGTKVISIWGGTDPLTGFGAWNESDELSVRIPVEELACRPCTVYGKGQCARGDFACMIWLTPEKVFRVVERVINIVNKPN